MKDKIDFLKSSINDIQSTIRAIDTKIIALLFIILIPITQIKLLFESIDLIYSRNIYLGLALILITSISWACSLTFSFLTIIGVRNPKDNFPNDLQYKGIYFGDDIYKLRFRNLISLKRIENQTSIPDYVKKFECNNEVLFNELVFEQVKLTLIRDLKMLRQKVAFISLYITTIFTVITILLGIILANYG